MLYLLDIPKYVYIYIYCILYIYIYIWRMHQGQKSLSDDYKLRACIRGKVFVG